MHGMHANEERPFEFYLHFLFGFSYKGHHPTCMVGLPTCTHARLHPLTRFQLPLSIHDVAPAVTEGPGHVPLLPRPSYPTFLTNLQPPSCPDNSRLNHYPMQTRASPEITHSLSTSSTSSPLLHQDSIYLILPNTGRRPTVSSHQPSTVTTDYKRLQEQR